MRVAVHWWNFGPPLCKHSLSDAFSELFVLVAVNVNVVELTAALTRVTQPVIVDVRKLLDRVLFDLFIIGNAFEVKLVNYIIFAFSLIWTAYFHI